MKKPSRALTYLRTAMVIIALALPLLSLIVLGSLWLFERGYFIYWAIAACLATVSAYAIERWLLRDAVASARATPDEAAPPEASWTAQEVSAWDAVQKVVNSIEPAKLDSRDAVLALGTRTIDAVARQMHTGAKDPLWKFTLPEALALVERVSGELGPFVRDNIPLGDRLTVAQVMAIYRWRGVIGIAQSGYDLWRIIRLMNPASAITQEMRETVTKQIYDWGRDELGRRLAAAYVREVGRAAIDLYGGRLRVSPEALSATVTEATRADLAEKTELAEPLRILVVGQVSAGKSSLINALSDAVEAAVDVLPATKGFTAYELKREGAPEALLIDSPGLSPEDAAMRNLLDEAGTADFVLWVTSITRPDRETDRKALDTLRDHLAARVQRRPPPILVIVTHVDQLRPAQVWDPPYDIQDGDSPKAASIRQAVETVAAELDAPIQSVMPVCLDRNRGLYNVDIVWAKMLDVMPEAQSARLVRVLTEAGGALSWRRVWTQAANAGRVITRALKSS